VQDRDKKEEYPMHELAVMEDILKTTVAFATAQQARKILRINLTLGGFSGVVPLYAGQFFKMIARDTIAAEAELVFTRVPGCFICELCKQETRYDDISQQPFLCGHCKSARLRLVSGREFCIDSLEIECVSEKEGAYGTSTNY